jgi:hypothetical protein
MRKEVLDTVLAKAHHALKQHDVAKASGDKRAIADARRDLTQAQGDLLKARAEIDAFGGIAKALSTPARLGSNSQWLR